jgi:hypothetical protein
MPLSKRSLPSEKGSSSVSLTAFGDWAKSYPQVCEFLSCLTYANGDSRELGSLRLSVRDGRLLVCLTDQDTNQYCFVSGDSLAAVLKSSCRAVDDPTADWRTSKPLESPKGKKR